MDRIASWQHNTKNRLHRHGINQEYYWVSVYTVVTWEAAATLLARYPIGQLLSLDGITAGVVNTNYRLRTDQGEYILTLIENPEHGRELPYLVHLLHHLAVAGIPCPLPIADRQGQTIAWFQERPALLVTLLPGESPEPPTVAQCAVIGQLLGRIHLAGVDFPLRRDNPMGAGKWHWQIHRLAAPAIGLDPEVIWMLQTELGQRQGDILNASIPMGVCHADLFPDNTLFVAQQLTGVIDFHYACHERWLYDLAITLNAWGYQADGSLRPDGCRALLQAYDRIRPLTPEERPLLGVAMRAASLRFALSRLDARHFPRAGVAVTCKPPEEYLHRLRCPHEDDHRQWL